MAKREFVVQAKFLAIRAASLPPIQFLAMLPSDQVTSVGKNLPREISTQNHKTDWKMYLKMRKYMF